MMLLFLFASLLVVLAPSLSLPSATVQVGQEPSVTSQRLTSGTGQFTGSSNNKAFLRPPLLSRGPPTLIQRTSNFSLHIYRTGTIPSQILRTIFQNLLIETQGLPSSGQVPSGLLAEGPGGVKVNLAVAPKRGLFLITDFFEMIVNFVTLLPRDGDTQGMSVTIYSLLSGEDDQPVAFFTVK